jgi:hypothetical protein
MTALPRGLRATGTRHARWIGWQQQQRAVVMSRCHGRCEASGCANPAEEWHHCFGRRHIIAEPLASHHTMTAGLCGNHHRALTRGLLPSVDRELMAAALMRAVSRFKIPVLLTESHDSRDELCGAARAIEDALRSDDRWQALCEEAGQ